MECKCFIFISFSIFDSLTQASIRDGDGNTPLHLACLNEDLMMVDALLKPITDEELKEYQQSATYQLPKSNVNRQIPIDLEQRNFYGMQMSFYLFSHISMSRNYTAIYSVISQARSFARSLARPACLLAHSMCNLFP